MTSNVGSAAQIGDGSSGFGAANHETLRPLLIAFFRRRLRDPQEVDDLVQEVFVRLVRHGEFGEGENLEAYAYRSAQSVLLDRARYRRSRQSDRHVEFDPDLHAASADRTEDAIFAREALRNADDALARLPDRTRHVFLLRRMDGLAMNEIADHLGISVSSAEKHLKRAALQLVKSRRRAQ